MKRDILIAGLIATVTMAEFAVTCLLAMSAHANSTLALAYVFGGIFVMLWTVLLGVLAR